MTMETSTTWGSRRPWSRTGSWATATTLSTLPSLCSSTGTQRLGRCGWDVKIESGRIIGLTCPETVGLHRFVMIYTHNI